MGEVYAASIYHFLPGSPYSYPYTYLYTYPSSYPYPYP